MIFAISDLHLPGGDKKPMEIFGEQWSGHFERISRDWRARVAPEDIVLLAGDISWAMRLEDARDDLAAIGALPGRKVILRGNHDYWWSSISRLRAALPEGMYALQNDAVRIGNVVVCGSRGWTAPESANATEEDGRIFARELARLDLSLAAAGVLADEIRAEGEMPRLVAMVHYPPVLEAGRPSEVTRRLSASGVRDAVYGHLHGPGRAGAFSGELQGVRYHFTSCDGLDFRLLALPEVAENRDDQ